MKKYKVNDIFYSIQGEGHLTGCAAIFIRFAGCNLRCPFCDTEFESYHEWDADYIVLEMHAHCIDHGVSSGGPLVVLTGGEPTLQVDEKFVDLLHEEGFRVVAMESNGLLPAPRNLDWLTVSPKTPWYGRRKSANVKSVFNVKRRHPDEIKIVFDGKSDPEKILADYKESIGGFDNADVLLYLQPCDTGNILRNKIITAECVDYVMRHTGWMLSLQTHKFLGIM